MRILLSFLIVAILSFGSFNRSQGSVETEENQNVNSTTGSDVAEALAQDPWFFVGRWYLEGIPPEKDRTNSAISMDFIDSGRSGKPSLATTRFQREGRSTNQTRTFEEALAWIKGRMIRPKTSKYSIKSEILHLAWI